MAIKIFVLGRPGSGKSTAARYLKRLLQQQEVHVVHFNDYDILQEMFLADIHHQKFRPTEHNGFDALDFSVLDDALQELELRVREVETMTGVITIEFARDDYARALRLFSPAFLRGAYLLFIDTDLETCLHRVLERVKRAASADDHPSLSEDLFRCYYAYENRLYMSYYARGEFALQQVEVVDNAGSLDDFISTIKQFSEAVLVHEAARPRERTLLGLGLG
ncbi:MAG: hypothetical protein E6J34_21585 [Chloroflexi bacterium]|nr:MAG: hypothetical protein E6J34_21585 [Chloroflexota bacterium]